MRIMTAFALGTALVLCNLGTFSAAAHARKAKVVREPRVRLLIVRVPVVRPTPYWDSYIVPRYRYRPQDDRIDPYGPPVVPMVRYGAQEETLPGFAGAAFHREQRSPRRYDFGAYQAPARTPCSPGALNLALRSTRPLLPLRP